MAQSTGLMATAPFLMRISFSPGGVYGAALISRGVARAAVSHAAVLKGEGIVGREFDVKLK